MIIHKENPNESMDKLLRLRSEWSKSLEMRSIQQIYHIATDLYSQQKLDEMVKDVICNNNKRI